MLPELIGFLGLKGCQEKENKFMCFMGFQSFKGFLLLKDGLMPLWEPVGIGPKIKCLNVLSSFRKEDLPLPESLKRSVPRALPLAMHIR